MVIATVVTRLVTMATMCLTCSARDEVLYELGEVLDDHRLVALDEGISEVGQARR